MTVERRGLLHWRWEARGVLRRGLDLGTIIVLPTGHPILIDTGSAWTRRGAERKARRCLERHT